MSLSHCKYKDDMPSITCSEIFAYKILFGGFEIVFFSVGVNGRGARGVFFLRWWNLSLFTVATTHYIIISLQYMLSQNWRLSGIGLLVQYEAFPAPQAGNSGTRQAGGIKEVQETIGRVFTRAKATCAGGITTALWLQDALPSGHRAQYNEFAEKEGWWKWMDPYVCHRDVRYVCVQSSMSPHWLMQIFLTCIAFVFRPKDDHVCQSNTTYKLNIAKLPWTCLECSYSPNFDL